MKAIPSACLFTLVALSIGAVAGVGIDSSEFKSPAARNATETYAGVLAKLNKDHKEKSDAARKTCIAQLTTAQAAATKAGNLDEAIRIRDAIARLNSEIQEGPAGSATATGRATGFAAEQRKLTQAVANSVWVTGEFRIRFNDDGSGNYLDGNKPDASKPPWAWVALNNHEIFVRYSSGWVNRMDFDDAVKTFVLHDPGNGKKLDVPGGKRVQ